jgi:hypothetical protein
MTIIPLLVLLCFTIHAQGISCPAGSYLDGGTCALCDAGWFSRGNSSSCFQCAPGSYSGSPGSANCTLCAPGSYAYWEAATECDPCPSGSFSATYGSMICSECLPGTVSHTGAVNCTECSSCPVCIPGWHLNEQWECAPCAPGTFTNSEVALDCDLCPAGSYSDESATECSLCEPGYYSASGSPSCTHCRENTIAPNNGSSTCTPCVHDEFSEDNVQCIGCVGWNQWTYSQCPKSFPITFGIILGIIVVAIVVILLRIRARRKKRQTESYIPLGQPLQDLRPTV